jgi:poly-gamma-glutamate synthesis protein (capsule biosynthesis protein)
VTAEKRSEDLVVASVHWSENWGYGINRDERVFAHALIDRGAVDLVHGHSSHHPKGIEVYQRKLILWGCGDFINDYEGIGGHEEFRPGVGLMYFATLDDATGDLVSLELVATQMKKFQVRLAATEDARWLCSTLNRESARFGASVRINADGTFALGWSV